MKIKNMLAATLATGLLLASCDKFDSMNTNPDASTKANASMMATALILNITQQGSAKNFVWDNMLSKQMAWSEGAQDEQYNLFGRTDFDGYTILTNCAKMVEAADNEYKNSYMALGKFVKAYKLFYKSLQVGDIPYSDALKGEEGVQKPKYDTQKEVMRQVLEDLEEAYALFSFAKNFDGDPIFGGDTEKWKKTVTAFELKVLMHLCKKESDPDLNVKGRFAKLVASNPLMESNDDNFQLVYSNKAGQIYPFNDKVNKHYGYVMLTNMIIDNLKKFNDYRMFYYASPSIYQTKAGVSDTEWEAYLSVDPSDSYSHLSELYGEGKSCLLNVRYVELPEGEPLIRLGYAEQNFILAEAAVRGWISGNASDYYKKGIEASMLFIAAHTPDEAKYHHGHPITAEYIKEYLAQPVIQLNGNKEKDLEMILLQRYLYSFMQHPYDAYYDYRRTGYPVLPINPNTNLNTDKNKIPVRWMYPESEFEYNTENANEAVQRQYAGSDNVNKLMWILQD